MIRQPTPDDALLRWHRAALAGHEPPRHPSWPECGWYKCQLARRGPYIPVLIYLDREVDDDGDLTAPEEIRADVFGDPADPEDIWTYLEPITEAQYDALVAERLATQHNTDLRRRVNLSAEPTLPGVQT